MGTSMCATGLGAAPPRSLLIEQAYAIAPKEPYRIRGETLALP